MLTDYVHEMEECVQFAKECPHWAADQIMIQKLQIKALEKKVLRLLESGKPLTDVQPLLAENLELKRQVRELEADCANLRKGYDDIMPRVLITTPLS